MATTIVSGTEYKVEQGAAVVINTDHTTPGSIQFALDGSANFGTAEDLAGGLNLFQNFRGRFKCSGFSDGNFIEFTVTPSS